MDALRRVLDLPRSIDARRKLAAEWLHTGDPRSALIERQVRQHDGLGFSELGIVGREIRQLLRNHGREWAGKVADIAAHYDYELGLVAGISITGDKWLQYGAEFVRTAPIIRLHVEGPADLAAIGNTHALENICLFSVSSGPWLNDEAVEAFSKSPYISQLRGLQLIDGNIGARGTRALKDTDKLPRLVYADLTGNPAQRIGDAGGQCVNDTYFVFGPASQPYWDAAFAAAAQSYDPHGVQWPPLYSDLCWDP